MEEKERDKVGRPSKYNYDLCVDICNEVAEGNNIKSVLKSKKEYPSFQTWCTWKRSHSELLDLYVKSIQDKAESVDADIDDIMYMLKNGEIEPSAANVLIQTLKWKASKYYPKMFGDRVDVTTDGEKVNTPTQVVWGVIDSSKSKK